MPDDPRQGESPVHDLPSPRIGRQLAQLIVIPALIVVAGILAALLFVWMASAEQTLDSDVAALRGCQGGGKGPMGFQNPSQKDCWYAAFRLADRIDRIDDAEQRRELSDSLIEILDTGLPQDTGLLHKWLFVAIGRLGQEGGLAELISGMKASNDLARQGAVEGLLNWVNLQEIARGVLPDPSFDLLVQLLADQSPAVAELAAATLGEFAMPEHEYVVPALARVLEGEASGRRDVRWNAAVALARLGRHQPRGEHATQVAKGSRIVAHLLLDREALALQRDGVVGDRANSPMAAGTQDYVILSTLLVAKDYTDDAIWDKIERLASEDQSRRVQTAARQRLLERKNRSKSTEKDALTADKAG